MARALALFGMLVVNFELVLGASGKGPAWLAALSGSFQGRAAATFVVLAGVGASLGSARARASGDRDLQRRARRTLLRRGLALFLGGSLFLLVWPADILHFYGVWLGLGAVLLFARSWILVAAMAAAVAGGALFLLRGEFFAQWNLMDLSYRGLGTPAGFLRNLFLNGWHPVLPWFALYVYGMLLGRLDLSDRRLRLGLLFSALWVGAAVLGVQWRWAPELEWELLPGHLLRTSSFPPTPAFVEFGACVASVLIVLSSEFAERFPRISRPLGDTGRLALTLYVAHVLVGLGLLEALGRLQNQSLVFAVSYALGFFLASVLFASLWLRRMSRGPLEALLRKV